jgi:diadenosine tetraphosphate (Ap4A) HIT family hydrolase
VSGFTLAPAIEATSAPLCQLELCEARLQLDAAYPWIVLIPRRAGLTELEHLTLAERAMLMEEQVRAGAAVRAIGDAWAFSVSKLNVACLGNVTSQLHIHVVGRRPGDPSWPSPVWGRRAPIPPSAEAVVLARHTALPWLQSPRPGPDA